MYRILGNTLSFGCVLGSLWLIAVVAVYAEPEDQKGDAKKPSKHFSLKSDTFATPISLFRDPQAARVAAIELAGELPSQETGTAELTLDESSYSFSEFGDAAVAQQKPPHKISVQLKRDSDSSDLGSVFEVTAGEAPLKQHVYVVIRTSGKESSELIVGDPQQTESNGMQLNGFLPEQVIKLQSATSPEHERWPKQKLRREIHMTTDRFHAEGDDPRKLGSIEIFGRLGDKGWFEHDKNLHIYSSSAKGGGAFSTLMGSPRQTVRFKPRELPDPTGKDRRIYDLDFDEEQAKFGNVSLGKPARLGQVSLVVSPEVAGPHRLVIRQGEQVKYVLSLTLSGLGRWEELQAATRQLPESERKAITEISDMVSENFFDSYRIEQGHVVSLHLIAEETSRSLLAILPTLSELRDLGIHKTILASADYKSNLTPAELGAGLRKLPTLKKLSMGNIDVNNELFEALAELPRLESLTIQNNAEAAAITDEHLRLLSRSKSIKKLNLFADKVTDAGLLHLAGMGQLSHLGLSSRHITGKGANAFRSQHSQCDVLINGEKNFR